jgi:formylmethanofuran dehydrogenase subunit D
MDFTKKYVSEVIEADDGSGDAILQFPDEMIESLGWEEGDTLSITTENDSIILKKKYNV